MAEIQRCEWSNSADLGVSYHDNDKEWGVVSRDDRHLFEMLVLEGAQASLNWNTILKKRAVYRKVYYDFNPEKVARFTSRSVLWLLGNAGIARNRLKIEA